MYWSTDTLVSIPIFDKMIARDRYLVVRFLHFPHKNNYDANDSHGDTL